MPDKHKALLTLIRHGDWMWSYDFCRTGTGEMYLSHRGPARISEVRNEIPHVIEVEVHDRTHRYRFAKERYGAVRGILPMEYRNLIDEELRRLSTGQGLF